MAGEQAKALGELLEDEARKLFRAIHEHVDAPTEETTLGIDRATIRVATLAADIRATIPRPPPKNWWPRR